MTVRTALITGASAGLGAEFARQLADKGLHLVLVARRRERMQDLADEIIEKTGVRVNIVEADLSKRDSVSELYNAIRDLEIPIDYLINNAGSAGPDLLDDRSWSEQRRYIELMMTSVAGLCHYFIPPMQQRGFGRVLNVASVAGHLSIAGDTSYGPTKAYLIALSKGLAATVRNDGVHVLALCPGFTHTDFHQSDALQRMKRETPDFLWYDADVVIREGLQALERGKTVYVTGRLYRYLTPILRSAAGNWIVARMGARRDY